MPNLFVDEGQIYPQVLTSATPDLWLFDLQDGSIDYARRLIVEAYRKPFDLAVEPLVRPYIIRLATDDVLIGLITHHTIIDPAFRT